MKPCSASLLVHGERLRDPSRIEVYLLRAMSMTGSGSNFGAGTPGSPRLRRLRSMETLPYPSQYGTWQERDPGSCRPCPGECIQRSCFQHARPLRSLGRATRWGMTSRCRSGRRSCLEGRGELAQQTIEDCCADAIDPEPQAQGHAYSGPCLAPMARAAATSCRPHLPTLEDPG